jgi:hypothetical protein
MQMRALKPMSPLVGHVRKHAMTVRAERVGDAREQ